MATDYNRNARGLLAYLDAKTVSQPVQRIAEEASAIIDLAPFFLAQGAEDVWDESDSVTGAGFWPSSASNALLVPQNEIWLVSQHTVVLSGGASLPALTTYGLVAALQTNSGIRYALEPAGVVNRFTSGSYPVASASKAYVARPGDQLGFLVNDIALGTAQLFRTNLQFLRLQI